MSSALQQPPDVLTRIAGLADNVYLPDAGVARLPHDLDEAGVGLVQALLCSLVGTGRLLKLGHRLLLIHGAMFAHRDVANRMMPP